MGVGKSIYTFSYAVGASLLGAWAFVAYQGSTPLTVARVFWFLTIAGGAAYAVGGLWNLLSYRFQREASVNRVVAMLHEAQFPRSDYKNFKNGYGDFPSKAAGADGYIGEIAQWARWKNGANLLATEEGNIPKWLIAAVQWDMTRQQVARLANNGVGSAYAEDRMIEVSDMAVARYLKDDPAYS
ncbi:MAG TPA: hypothetical protein VGI91_09050 [Steroidobacteraceae bacterium]